MVVKWKAHDSMPQLSFMCDIMDWHNLYCENANTFDCSIKYAFDRMVLSLTIDLFKEHTCRVLAVSGLSNSQRLKPDRHVLRFHNIPGCKLTKKTPTICDVRLGSLDSMVHLIRASPMGEARLICSTESPHYKKKLFNGFDLDVVVLRRVDPEFLVALCKAQR